MYQVDHSDDVSHYLSHRPRRSRAVRTYTEIAEILKARDAVSVTPARVARICRMAEITLARALMADPVIREELSHLSTSRRHF